MVRYSSLPRCLTPFAVYAHLTVLDQSDRRFNILLSRKRVKIAESKFDVIVTTRWFGSKVLEVDSVLNLLLSQGGVKLLDVTYHCVKMALEERLDSEKTEMKKLESSLETTYKIFKEAMRLAFKPLSYAAKEIFPNLPFSKKDHAMKGTASFFSLNKKLGSNGRRTFYRNLLERVKLASRKTYRAKYHMRLTEEMSVDSIIKRNFGTVSEFSLKSIQFLSRWPELMHEMTCLLISNHLGSSFEKSDVPLSEFRGASSSKLTIDLCLNYEGKDLLLEVATTSGNSDKILLRKASKYGKILSRIKNFQDVTFEVVVFDMKTMSFKGEGIAALLNESEEVMSEMQKLVLFEQDLNRHLMGLSLPSARALSSDSSLRFETVFDYLNKTLSSRFSSTKAASMEEMWGFTVADDTCLAEMKEHFKTLDEENKMAQLDEAIQQYRKSYRETELYKQMMMKPQTLMDKLNCAKIEMQTQESESLLKARKNISKFPLMSRDKIFSTRSYLTSKHVKLENLEDAFYMRPRMEGEERPKAREIDVLDYFDDESSHAALANSLISFFKTQSLQFKEVKAARRLRGSDRLEWIRLMSQEMGKSSSVNTNITTVFILQRISEEPSSLEDIVFK